jgi:hypothetical protein
MMPPSRKKTVSRSRVASRFHAAAEHHGPAKGNWIVLAGPKAEMWIGHGVRFPSGPMVDTSVCEPCCEKSGQFTGLIGMAIKKRLSSLVIEPFPLYQGKPAPKPPEIVAGEAAAHEKALQ